MSLYRRLARSKKGMSTIFGGLFFIILILMGFNVMLWGFVQWDSYNHILTSMSQRDQQAISENLVPVNATCDTSCKFSGTDPLNIWVNNLGASSVSVASVYLSNVNSTTPCAPTPCILNPILGTGNIPAGSTNWAIKVQGISIGSSSYHIIIATTRGREFSLYYPWRFNSLTINNIGNGNFVTNVGPLAIFFDFTSFNFTMGTQTTSQPAWILPEATPIVLYIKVVNEGTAPVCLLPQSAILFQPYATSGNAGVAIAFIVNSTTTNPSLVKPFIGTQCLQVQNPNGPSASYVLKFTGQGQSQPNPAVPCGSSNCLSMKNTDVPYLLFIGFFYTYGGPTFAQGETVPFVAIRACASYPTPC